MASRERWPDKTTPTRESLEGLQGFRVEWDDGTFGIAGGMAIVVQTEGLGSGHHKVELLALDDVVAILPDERRILARTGVPRAGPGSPRALGRALLGLLRGRRQLRA
ncbi:MAG: hypothetical protein WD689_02650 [Gaiellaceae bacterium]